jgi:TonB family protein
MVTNEAIVSGIEPAHVFESEPVAAPTFSSLESASRPSAGGGRFLRIALLLALFWVGGYYAWRQPQVQQLLQKYLHRGDSTQVAPAPDVPSEPTSAAPITTQRPIEAATPAVPDSRNAGEVAAQLSSAHAQNTAQTLAHGATKKSPTPEEIEVQELPMGRDSGKIAVTPKPQPIMVKSDSITHQPAQPTAPPVNLVGDADASKLPSLAPVNIELPKAAPGTVRISQGVSQGLLLKKVQPVYPSVAKQLRKEGIVQLLATINKSGDVSKVQTLGGDPMLAKAAVDAVKQWKYRPYLLNGLPVEIETQISIVFKGLD